MQIIPLPSLYIKQTDEAPQKYNSSQRLKSLREKEQKGLKKYETKLSFVKVEG